MRYLFVLLFIFCNLFISAQDISQDSLLAKRYYSIADTSYRNLDTCLFYSQKALPYLKKAKMWNEYIRTLNGITYCYKGQNDLAQYKKNVYFTLDESNRVDVSDEGMKFSSLINYAVYLFDIEKDFKKANRIYLENVKSMQFENPIWEAKLYNNFGSFLESQGDFVSALPYLKRALTIYYENDAELMEVYKTTSIIANCYFSQKKYKDARNYYLQAYKILKPYEKEKGVYQYYINIYLSLAEVNLSMENYAVAQDYLDKLEQFDLSILDKVEKYQIASRVFLAQKKYDKSEALLKKSLNIVSTEIPLIHVDILNNLGEFYIEKNESKKALQYINEGIWMLVENAAENNDKNKLPNKNAILKSEQKMFNLLALKTEILSANKDILSLKEALSTYEYAFFIQQQLQQQIFDDRSKIFRNQTYAEIQENALARAWQLYEIQQDIDVVEKAFLFIETAKSSVLLEEIKRRESEGFSNVDEVLLEQRYSLLGELKYIQRSLVNAEGKQKTALEKLYVEKQEEITILNEKIKKDNPDYVAAVKDYEPISIRELREVVLDENTAIIEYVLTDSFVYVLMIDDNNLRFNRFLKTTLKNEIQELLKLREYHTKSEKETYNKIASSIYQQLLAPLNISNNIDHLIIVPDGILLALPFEMLLTNDNSFVLEKYATSYAYSAAILNKLNNTNKKQDNKLLAFAPVFENQKNKIPLILSEEEINAIPNYFLTTKKITKNASKDNFIKEAFLYDFIHLSTHASAKGNEEPFIMFYEDTLFLEELYARKFQAEMIVMSACETAIGKDEKGEGLMSLSRGFTYAGIPSQVTSLWSVNESATKDIVIAFYENLSNGMNKAEALQNAKKSYLETALGDKASPYYWAGLIQLGDFQPIKNTSIIASNVIYIIAGLILVLLIFFFIKKRK